MCNDNFHQLCSAPTSDEIISVIRSYVFRKDDDDKEIMFKIMDHYRGSVNPFHVQETIKKWKNEDNDDKGENE